MRSLTKRAPASAAPSAAVCAGWWLPCGYEASFLPQCSPRAIPSGRSPWPAVPRPSSFYVRPTNPPPTPLPFCRAETSRRWRRGMPQLSSFVFPHTQEVPAPGRSLSSGRSGRISCKRELQFRGGGESYKNRHRCQVSFPSNRLFAAVPQTSCCLTPPPRPSDRPHLQTKRI